MEASEWIRVNLAGVSVLTDRIVSSNRVADDCFILRNIPKCQRYFFGRVGETCNGTSGR
jgi:hypothetical protein